MRKVIQISSAPWDGSVAINALCDDGTMWEMNGGRWVELPAIPQDESNDPLASAVGKLNAVRLYAESYRDSDNQMRRTFGVNMLRRLDSKG